MKNEAVKTGVGTVTTAVRQFETVVKILEEHDYNREKLIPMLHAVQEECRYLPETVMMYVANALGISPARVYGVATFYAHFALVPKGKYVIRVCDGTACHVKGSMNMHATMKKMLERNKTSFLVKMFRTTVYNRPAIELQCDFPQQMERVLHNNEYR